MKWRDRKRSSNVDIRRGGKGSKGRKVGLGGIGAIILGLAVMYFNNDPTLLMNASKDLIQDKISSSKTMDYEPTKQDLELENFVSVVLQDTEDVWNKLFRKENMDYPEPTLVIFKNQVKSACGTQSSATGPFYCPGDDQLYIDLSFCNEMKNKLGAPGDFAIAYVIAHEVGHHIQNKLGISTKVQEMKRGVSKKEANKLSVRMELQADFLAGVWAHHAQKMKNILDEGDIEEAINAANSIGDDHLQKQAQGYVVPDAFTHGTSEQRVRWFKKGFVSGDINKGDTFAASIL